MNGLTLHCGAAAVSREQVTEVETPEATQSWFPIPHIKLVNRVEEALTNLGIRVVSQAHALTKDGARYFGLLRVENCKKTAEDYGFVVGLRNSHDKSIVASLAVGTQVFVCDNLAFSAEITIARKHTRHIEADLPKLTGNAVGLLSQKWTTMADRIALYKESVILDSTAHDLIIRAVDARACTLSQVPTILKEWRTPRHKDFEPRTAWSLMNSFTEAAKEGSLNELTGRATRLTGLLDTQVRFVVPDAQGDLLKGTEGGEDIEVHAHVQR